MKLATRIVGVALSATALCGVSIGSASAATPGDSRGSVSIANNAAEPLTTVVAYSAYLNTTQSVSLPAFACPPEHPWLLNPNLSPGRIVPRGVAINEPGGIGVTIFDAARDPERRAVGWRSGSATNWGFRQILTVSAVCTNNPAGSYQA